MSGQKVSSCFWTYRSVSLTVDRGFVFTQTTWLLLENSKRGVSVSSLLLFSREESGADRRNREKRWQTLPFSSWLSNLKNSDVCLDVCVYYNLRMTPLGASLIFVFISILVSLFRHLFFHSSSINGNDDSNITITKLHTITITQNVQQRQPYNSLYEAYFKPQIPK